MGGNIFLALAAFISGGFASNLGILSYKDPDLWKGYPECKADLDKLAQEENQIWALKIVDASTKIPSGILTGHFVDYGNFDECLSPGGPFKTQHCLATIFPPPDLIEKIAENDSLAMEMALRWSYCVPASCPPAGLQSVLQELLKPARMNVSVSSSTCSAKDAMEMTARDYVGVFVWGLFAVSTVASTIYDFAVDKMGGTRTAWLSAFSLYTNGKNILKTEVSPETMLPLHGLRFLSICWVVLGHRYFFASSSSLLNLVDFAKEIKQVRSQFFMQGVLAVDTFFLLSGLLNCYNLLKVLEKLNRFPIRRYYVHRYIRLTPALAAIVLMYATWYPFIGSGPAWTETTLMWKRLCVDNWWSTLLYINNYYNPIAQCAGQSWYLAVDMQLYWLSPLIILPLWKRPRMGMALLWFLLFLSTISQFLIAYLYKFRMSFIFTMSSLEEVEKVMRVIYVPTHTRATPYIIGVMIGHYLFHLKKTKTRQVMSKGFLCSGWFLSTLVALSVVFGNFQFSRPVTDHSYNVWESSSYIAFHRIGWSASIAWIIVTCLNGQGGVVNSILSWKAFVPLSRLTYCIFLSHMAIQQYHMGTARTSDYFQYFNQIHRYFGDLVFSVMTGAGLSLMFESPILTLEKLAGGGRKPQERNLKSQINDGFRDDFNTTDKTHEI